MIETIRLAVSESLQLKQSFFQTNEGQVVALAQEICRALRSGGKVLLFGNGGSAADAQHIAAEWVGRFRRERDPLAAVALTTDSSILTSLGNDYGFEEVFARQVRALGRSGDVAFGISTSGNSANVLRATAAAVALEMTTVALTGGDGGKLGSMVQHHLNVPSPITARVQETHIMIGHILCELVDEHLGD